MVRCLFAVDVKPRALVIDVSDVDFLASRSLVPADWAKRFPNNASPTYSTMLFLVRRGNPKGIKDWDDLAKPGVQVVILGDDGQPVSQGTRGDVCVNCLRAFSSRPCCSRMLT